MEPRLIALLRELMASETPLTSTYLANLNQVTSRTTREDIKNLNAHLEEHGALIKSQRGKGYIFEIENEHLFRAFVEEVMEESSRNQLNNPALPEERVHYLVKRLLLSNDYVKLDDMADEMLISKSTIQNDIRAVKDILDAYDIKLEKRPNYGLKAIGSEVKLRFCMSEYIFNRSEKSGEELFHKQLPSFISEDLHDVWTIILEQIKDHHITLSDIAINNLFIHIAITYERVQSGHYISLYPKEFDEIVEQKEYQVAKQIIENVEDKLEMTFPDVEVAYIAIHLLGTKMLSQTNLSHEGVEHVLDESVYHMTLSILETIENKLHLGIKQDQELIVGLGLHLKPAVNRYHYGMNIRNPMLDDIKKNYPVAFEAAIIAGIVLEDIAGVMIEESEIGYIALHIGAAMERKKLQKGPQRCMVICASGAGSAQLIYYKLKAQFGSKLDVVGTTEYYKLAQMSFEDLDFVVSTISLPDELPIPVIEVNTILGEGDLQKVEDYVQESKESIFEFIKEELVFLNQSFQSKEEVLTFMNDKLLHLGYVDETYLEKVYEREAVAPTSFGNLVAIPHPISPHTSETHLVICTLQKPIMWEDKRVQFVCFLNVEKNSSADLQILYKVLGSIVDDLERVQQLLKCKTYEDVLRLLVR
ncbi:BglG family transcription antiterminator [Salsuginibacillus kocurii]|uniref:BglG family transcription antiterminator n=1 Tax=Salsuginibacillus kocurii TaxID=427078 RepID=UPI00035E47F6|nr:BglG family transcription antiterminator [Salsuginibacillus kocurii]